MPKVKEYSLPFSKDTDIKEYVNQFVPDPIEENLPVKQLPNLPVEDNPSEKELPKDSILPDTPLDIFG